MFIGIALSVTAGLLGGGFSPTILFSLNEPGIWLDLDDPTILFQDTAGTIPVTTPGQSVALALDKSQGVTLGPELFSRTLDFSNAVWLKTASVTSSGFQTFTTNAQGGVYSTIAGVSASARYRVRVTGSTTAQLAIRNDTDVAGQAIVPAGSFDVTMNSQVFSGSSSLFFQLGAAGTATITSVSIRELPGNHAVQATAGSRPKYALLPANGVRNLANGSASVADVSIWQSGLTTNGVTYTKVASGVGTDGLPYADYSAVGTASAVASFSAYVGTNSRAAAAVGQAFTTSFLAQVISGSIPPSQCGVRAEVYGETAPSTFVENSVGTATGPATETLITLTYTLANAASNQAYGNIILRTGIGDTVNYTIRIKALQFERAAARSAYQFNYANTNIAQPPYAQVGALLFDGVDDGMVTPSIDFPAYEQLGPELVVNGDFTSAAGWTLQTGWTIGSGVLSGNVAAAVFASALGPVTLTAGRAYQVTFSITAYTSGAVRPSFFGGTDVFGSTDRAAVGTFTETLVATTGNNVIGIQARAAGFVGTIDNVSVKQVIRPADKMTVFAGVRKLSDAAQGIVAELTVNAASTPNSFSLQAPGPATSYRIVSGGSLTAGAVFDATGLPAPRTSVLTELTNISGATAFLRENGTQVAGGSAAQGTGNYANAPLYIGRRGGASLPFSGYLYQLIVRGAPTTAADITATETWVNSKTGAY
jgi:hypothetical protein